MEKTSQMVTLHPPPKTIKSFSHNGKNDFANNNGHQKVNQNIVCTVVHAVPGRVRLRVPRLIQDADYAQRLQSLVALDTRIEKIRINRAAASVSFGYEARTVADEGMRSHLINLIQLASDVAVEEKTLVQLDQPESDSDSNGWGGLKLPAIATTLAILGGPLGFPIPTILLASTIAAATLPVAQRAWESIRQDGRLNIDFLDLSAIVITTCQGHFITPALMLSLVELGESIRERTARSSKRQTLDLLDSLGQFVWVERNGEKQEIPIKQVQPGDTVIVYPGEQVPVDGEIIQGKALIDQQKLTGESMPVMREVGEEVFASTLVREGQIYILAERVGADTRAGQSIRLMQEAPIHDTKIENYAAKVANQAVIPTILLAGGVFAATRNLARAASVLTLDFATGIRVSVPTTVLAALSYAARRGILIRSGRALEQLAKVDAVVFDKTGTLTQGDVAVIGVRTAADHLSETRLLQLAAAAEQRLTHPVANAIVRYAQEMDVEIPARGEWEYQVGLGVQAEIEGQTILVGSVRFLRSRGISLQPLYDRHPDLQANGASLIYIAGNNECLGAIAYTDPLRKESRQVIRSLAIAAGMEIHMLTGDSRQRANAVAAELGIPPTQTHAEAFPEDKATTIQQLHAAGRTVAFVGDGINDSAALAYADVSVSFADGSDVARETADVVLMSNDLRGLVEAVAIAKQAMELIHQNTGIVIVPNLTALIAAAVVGISPLAATVVNNGSSVIAGVNGLRPLMNGRKEPKKMAIANG
jgi:P-type Cu2+ transporter